MDPMENINNAADALRQVAERAGGFYDDADAQIVQRQGAYDALAANLKGVISDHMYFTGTVDPDTAAPTNVDGGTFSSIKTLVDLAPPGSYIIAYLQSDKTYDFDQDIHLHNQYVYLYKSGGGADPIVNVLAYATATLNSIYSFIPKGICGVSLYGIDLRLPTAAPDLELPWSSSRAFVGFHVGLPVIVGVGQSKISGGIAGVELGLMSNNGGGQSHLGLWMTTLDGPLVGVVQASNGVTFISRSTVTLLNGALEHSSGTLGTNLITN